MSVFEDTTRQIGWGLYHKFLVGMACACAFSQATAYLSIPFTLPVAACDVSLDESAVLSINLCLSLGMAFGGFILNCIADSVGRRFMIPTSLILMFGSNFACGFAHGYPMILVCAFFLGSGVASNAVSVKIHLGECLHSSKRGFYLVLPDLFWTLSYYLSALFSWIAIPSIMQSSTTEMRLATWRLMFGTFSAFSIIVACASALLQSSPRFLLYLEKYTEALENLKQVYTINNSKHCETFLVREDDLKNIINDYNINDVIPPENCSEQILTILRQIRTRSRLLLTKRFIAAYLVLIFLKIPLTFGILPTNIWLSKLLRKEEDCVLIGMDVLHLETMHVINNGCSLNTYSEVYMDFFLIAINIIIGQLVLMCIVEKIGRRNSIICGYAICGITGILLAYINNLYIIRLIVSSVFMACYSLLDSTMSILLVELFPTAFRGTAAAHICFLPYLIRGFLGKYLQTPCQYPFIVIGSFMFASSIVSFFIPDVSGRPMAE